jgi:hypothetical protein
MAIDPLRKSNRIDQKKSEKADIKQSITLFDIDYAIMTYLQDVVLPDLDDNGQTLKIPVIYGNSERWAGARREGVYRDIKGRIQLPILMIRRTSVAKNDAVPMLNRHVSYATISKYSKANRYEKFSILGATTKPKYELYNITMPDYVEINYECMGWTNYIEHLNTIVESLNFASDEYWGDKKKFKFNTTITDYTIVNEVGEGTERVNRVEFNLTVRAYLLPEKFDTVSTTKKAFSITRIVTSETDVTAAGRLEQVLLTPSPYYDNKDFIDFLTLNNSRQQNPVLDNTLVFTGIKLIAAPPQLAQVVTGSLTIDDTSYDVKLYINGVRYYQTSHFTVTYSISSATLTINFIAANLGFTVDSGDEITITGKFIDL